MELLRYNLQSSLWNMGLRDSYTRQKDFCELWLCIKISGKILSKKNTFYYSVI